jgi:hypothetical protein
MSVIITVLISLFTLTATDSPGSQPLPSDTPVEILTDEGGAG